LEEGKWADMIIVNANKWVHVHVYANITVLLGMPITSL
jgi:imidazolonepropionase-like amidohydrolase